MSVYFLILLTAVLWGIAPIFDKAALKNGDPFSGVLIRGIIIGIIMLAVTLASGKAKSILNLPKQSIAFFVISGLLAGGLGVFTYYKALQFDSTSKIVPLAATYPLITALLSILFLGENITLARFIGTILIISGIFLVK